MTTLGSLTAIVLLAVKGPVHDSRQAPTPLTLNTSMFSQRLGEQWSKALTRPPNCFVILPLILFFLCTKNAIKEFTDSRDYLLYWCCDRRKYSNVIIVENGSISGKL